MNTKNILAAMVVVLACVVPGASAALSLGELEVGSSPNEPFRGDIEVLSFNPDTPISELRVGVPPTAMFQRFGLRKNGFLDGLRFNHVRKDNRLLIKLSAPRAVPALATDLLLQVETNSEKTLKKYKLSAGTQRTSALKQAVPVPVFKEKIPQHVDFGKAAPPVRQQTKQKVASVAPAKMVMPLASTKKASVVEAKPVKNYSQQPIRYVDQLPLRREDPAYQPVYTEPRLSRQSPKLAHKRKASYRVKKGDTLFKIAAKEKPSGLTADQMFFALYQKNATMLAPQKLDKLYIGQRLKLPSTAEVSAISRMEGRKFKQTYLDNHRRKIAQVKQAREQRAAELAARKFRQQAAKQKQEALKQQTEQELAPKQVKVHTANEATEEPNANIVVLEERLRKAKRLLKLEKNQHALTKQTLKKQNRLVQKKDTLLRGITLADNKGVRGSKIQDVGANIAAAPIGKSTAVSAVIQNTARHSNKISLAEAVERANEANNVEAVGREESHWLAPLLGGSVLLTTYLNQFIDAFKQPSSWIILLSCLALALMWTLFKLRKKHQLQEQRIAANEQARTIALRTEAPVNHSQVPRQVPQTVVVNSTETPKAVSESYNLPVGQFDDLRQQLTDLRGSLEALGENSRKLSAIRQDYADINAAQENTVKDAIDGDSLKLTDKPNNS